MNILIIDDDPDFRQAVRIALEDEGYAVSEAPCAKTGLDMARDQHPDLIVLDIMMESPVEGYSAVQALHAQTETADIPIVMVSSVRDDPSTLYGMAEDMEQIMPDAYFTKPLDTPVFLECVRKMLGQSPGKTAG